MIQKIWLDKKNAKKPRANSTGSFQNIQEL